MNSIHSLEHPQTPMYLIHHQFGLAEIKCPYKYHEIAPADASKEADFCCSLDGTNTVKLKCNSAYLYSQVQGQPGITERKWCDIIFTKKGISVERILYDADFWENNLLPKLTVFYDKRLCPSILSPIHLHGRKVHDLR